MTDTTKLDQFLVANQGYQLQRFPLRKKDQLRAWNSADSLLIESALEHKAERVLILNDEHGAISLALHRRHCIFWTDSYLSWQACEHNFELNKIKQLPDRFWSTEMPPDKFSLAVLRLPKQLAMLEHQLTELSALLAPGATLLSAGMDKHTPPQVGQMLDELIGETQRLPGVKKAHLFCSRKTKIVSRQSPHPSSYFCEPLGENLINHANLFSRDQLDIGARFMLESFSHLPSCETLFDLACGNGVLGIAAAQQLQVKNLKLFDESHMAVSCALANSETILNSKNIDIEAVHGDGLKAYQGIAPDLIICNPPFHHNFVVDEYIGQRLITDAAKLLQTGGKLWLVANRHLPYYRQLRSLFKSVREVSSNKKFMVLEACK